MFIYNFFQESDNAVKKLTNKLSENEKRFSEEEEKVSSLRQEVSKLQMKFDQLLDENQKQANKVVEIETVLSTQEAEMAALAGDKLELEVTVTFYKKINFIILSSVTNSYLSHSKG